jgi:hypothetical protein
MLQEFKNISFKLQQGHEKYKMNVQENGVKRERTV